MWDGQQQNLLSAACMGPTWAVSAAYNQVGGDALEDAGPHQMGNQ